MVICEESDTHKILSSGIRVESNVIRHSIIIPAELESFSLLNVTLIVGDESGQDYSFEPKLMKLEFTYKVEFQASLNSKQVKAVAMYGSQCNGASIVQIVKT